MNNKISSGQKIARKLSRLSKKASTEVIEHAQENLIDRVSHVRRVRLLILEWVLLVVTILILSITQMFWYSDSYATITYNRGGTYTEATLGEVKSLNPLFASTNSEKTISKLLFASLSSPDYSGHAGLDLAKSITTDEKGQVWTVVLRDNLKWSDNEPLTTEDVLYTAELIADPRLNTVYSSNLSGVKVEEKDGKIIFTLPTSNAFFESALDFPILPKHILDGTSPDLLLEHAFNTKPVTSGAFSHNATQNVGNTGEKIVYLTANSNYYKGRPLIDSFVVHAYMETESIINALNNGTVTASAALTGEDVKKVTSGNISEYQSSLNYGVYAFINNETIKGKDFRSAIRQGINMGEVRSLLNGERELDYPFVENQVKLTEYPEFPAYDKEKAKTVITEKLEKDEELRNNGISLVTVRSGILPAITDKLADQLRDLGLIVDVTVYESDQDFAINVLSQRAYDILVYEVGLGADPDLFAYYHTTQATSEGHNLSNYKNAVVSDLILSARATINPVLRSKKYQNFVKYFVEDTPAIGIYQSNMNYLVNNKVKAYSTENRLVTATDRFVDVAKWGVIRSSRNRTP